MNSFRRFVLSTTIFHSQFLLATQHMDGTVIAQDAKTGSIRWAIDCAPIRLKVVTTVLRGSSSFHETAINFSTVILKVILLV